MMKHFDKLAIEVYNGAPILLFHCYIYIMILYNT